MYNGNNPTALASQQMFLDALNELLKEKEFKDISISELCKLSGISRQTFYTLFGTKENILLYQLEGSPALDSRFDPNAPMLTIEDTCTTYANFVVSNYSTLQMLVDNGLLSVLSELIFRGMSGCRKTYMNVSEEERAYAAEFISSGLSALTRKYIVEHPKPDSEELQRLSFKMMSGGVFQ